MPAPIQQYAPAPPPAGRVASYIQEVLKLSPAQVRSVGLALQATLSNTSPVSDTYTVPADQDLVIFSLQGYLQFNSLAAEPTTGILSFLNPDPSERWFMKAQNCNLKLENLDRSLQVFDARDVPLSAISPPVGAPMFIPPEIPFIVPHKHRLRATFTLQDSTTAIVGSATKYGVLLTGALIPFRP